MMGFCLMKKKELERLRVVQMVIDGKITQKQASGFMDLSYRQTKRVVERIKEEGSFRYHTLVCRGRPQFCVSTLSPALSHKLCKSS